jgi:hypothetical protein
VPLPLTDGPRGYVPGTGECDLRVSTSETPAGYGDKRTWARLGTRCPRQTEAWWVGRQGSRTEGKRKKAADPWQPQETAV